MAEFNLSRADHVALSLIAEGRTNSEIASAMGLTPTAVRTLLSEICLVIGARSRAELSIYARDRQV